MDDINKPTLQTAYSFWRVFYGPSKLFHTNRTNVTLLILTLIFENKNNSHQKFIRREQNDKS